MEIPKAFIEYFEKCKIKNCDEFISSIKQYKKHLATENKKHNLTRIESDEDFINKHICDSLSIVNLFPEFHTENLSILDIGCGAGFPSFVLAAAFKNLAVTAIDSVGKKIDFLNSVSELTNTENLNALHIRSNELKTDMKFDIITARAVGDIFKIFKESRKLLTENGRYILYKTPENIDEDLLKANKLSLKFKFYWKKTDCFSLPGGNGERLFIVGKRLND